jgi:hypothetical protein
MNSRRKFTGILLLLTPLLFMGAFTLLQMNFEYPDILRQPGGTVLESFAAGGSGLVANWYAMLFSALLFIPVAVLLPLFLDSRNPGSNHPLTILFGILAGLVQALGFLRWPFLVPSLAAMYLDPAASEATRSAALVTFQAFNQYAGVGVGEHLGYLFTALWSLLIGLAMRKSGVFPAWLGWMGGLAAVGILLGTLEPFGVAWVGLVNAVAYIVWAVWLMVTGVFLLRAKER